MITVNLTEEQAKLIEDAIVRLAVTYSEKNEACCEIYKVVIDARHSYQVKKMISENSEAGSNWLNEEAV